MGKLDNGINGGFSGKVGTVVGFNWRGKSVIRSVAKKSNKPPTDKQLAQRQKLTVVSSFLKPARAIIDQWYGSPIFEKARINNATSYHLREAVSGDDAVFQINYKRVLLTLGELIGVQQAAILAGAGNSIIFSWSNNSDIGQAKPNDKMLAVAYEESSNRFEHLTSASRADGLFEMALPQDWSGKIVHCWISFISEDGSNWSTACYLGEVVTEQQ